METKEITKEQAIANYLGVDIDELQNGYDESNFVSGNAEYMILTDKEADGVATEYIRQSLWAFNSSFLSSETGLPIEVFEAIQANDKCESNNDVIEQCINDMDSFIEAAISADGRGHFMSSYDGEEIEQDGYYIYRIN